jgi:hypothetical protein
MNAQGLTLDSRAIVINSGSFGKGFLSTFKFSRSLIDLISLQLKDSFRRLSFALRNMKADQRRHERRLQVNQALTSSMILLT